MCFYVFNFLALMYPHKKVFVMFLTKTNSVHLIKSKLVDSLEAYKNVNFKFINIRQFAKGSPLESWLLTGKLDNSSFKTPHTSDVLRFLTLYKFGGIYLDLDVFVIKSTSLINFACAEDENFINGAVLNLSERRGKELATLFIKYCIQITFLLNKSEIIYFQ